MTAHNNPMQSVQIKLSCLVLPQKPRQNYLAPDQGRWEVRMSLSQKVVALILFICLVPTVSGQSRDIEEMSIVEIRSELDQILANEFNRATEWDRITVALKRITSMFERRPEAALTQLDISRLEMEIIQSVFETWLQSSDRYGDNRIAKMCEVWETTSLVGSDRVDAALLAYEREISTGYSDFNQRRVEQLLGELESMLSPDSWEKLAVYVENYLSRSSGDVSHSFFTRVVRTSQGVETMNLHCGN